jgi:excinuclease ABC subunit C
LISKENYDKDVQDTIAFLEGKSKVIIQSKQQAMLAAAEALEFEQAAVLRDQIELLETVQQKQFVSAEKPEDADVVTLLYDETGHIVVQLLMIRSGNLWASSSHFPYQAKDNNASLILSAFLLQYYTGREIPHRIILGQEPDDKAGLLAWFSIQAGKRVYLVTQARGLAQKWLQLALDNARQALTRLATTQLQKIKLLTQLQTRFDLPKLPQHIECFDISHLQGTNTVASCVVFIEGIASKKQYRRYNITGITAGDDLAAMKQVLSRRLLRGVQSDELPDLLIVDGGCIQLKMAVEQIAALGLQDRVMLLSIAKGEGRKAGLETYYRYPTHDNGIQLEADNPLAHLLQRIRDEAHRFAITAQRNSRKKSLVSGLEDIAGIGAKTKTKLLKAFSSISAVKEASLSQLASVAGVTQKQAQAVYAFFHDKHQ